LFIFLNFLITHFIKEQMTQSSGGGSWNGSTQTLKSAADSRVRIDQSQRLGSQRQNLGEGLLCPASAGDIGFDIYGRPATQNTLLLNDSACSHYTDFSTQRRMEIENLERPYLPICAAGLRGAGDLMHLGRADMPQDLYGCGSYRGNFVRHYNTPSNLPWSETPTEPFSPYYHKRIQPFSWSHDATGNLFRG